MTTLASRLAVPPEQSDCADCEVLTSSSDPLRATVCVRGTLCGSNTPLLTSVLDAHLRAGRRYLRVDLTGCLALDRTALAPMTEAHAKVGELGGTLVLERPTDSVAEVLARSDLFVSSRR